MAESFRVLLYLNQFFAGLGGEESANLPAVVRTTPLGAGRAVQHALGDAATIVATLVAGDNFASEQTEEVRKAMLAVLREMRPDVVIAGPPFEAGRYGLACGLVCKVAQEAGIPAVTATQPENPGVLSYRNEVLIVPTGSSPTEMPIVLASLVRLALKLARREELGPAEAEGYLPRGQCKVGQRQEPGFRRAVDLLVAKVTRQPFATELPVELPEKVLPAAPIADLSRAAIALVTTSELVRKGNPDKQMLGNPMRFYRHNVAELKSLSGDDWQAYHSGYFNHIINTNPNHYGFNRLSCFSY